MARLNVKQPDGGNAIFSTVVDDFIEFNQEPLPFAKPMEWSKALRKALETNMHISESIERAISLKLVSREECEAVLKELLASSEDDRIEGMKCSELIEFLKLVIKEHGDLPVGCMDHEYGDSHVAVFQVVPSNRDTEPVKECQDDAKLGAMFLCVR